MTTHVSVLIVNVTDRTELLKYRFIETNTKEPEQLCRLDTPLFGSLDKGDRVTLLSSDLSWWDFETTLWLSCLKRENRQCASFSGGANQGSASGQRTIYLAGWD